MANERELTIDFNKKRFKAEIVDNEFERIKPNSKFIWDLGIKDIQPASNILQNTYEFVLELGVAVFIDPPAQRNLILAEIDLGVVVPREAVELGANFWLHGTCETALGIVAQNVVKYAEPTVIKPIPEKDVREMAHRFAQMIAKDYAKIFPHLN